MQSHLFASSPTIETPFLLLARMLRLGDGLSLPPHPKIGLDIGGCIAKVSRTPTAAWNEAAIRIEDGVVVTYTPYLSEFKKVTFADPTVFLGLRLLNAFFGPITLVSLECRSVVAMVQTVLRLHGVEMTSAAYDRNFHARTGPISALPLRVATDSALLGQLVEKAPPLGGSIPKTVPSVIDFLFDDRRPAVPNECRWVLHCIEGRQTFLQRACQFILAIMPGLEGPVRAVIEAIEHTPATFVSVLCPHCHRFSAVARPNHSDLPDGGCPGDGCPCPGDDHCLFCTQSLAAPPSDASDSAASPLVGSEARGLDLAPHTAPAPPSIPLVGQKIVDILSMLNVNATSTVTGPTRSAAAPPSAAPPCAQSAEERVRGRLNVLALLRGQPNQPDLVDQELYDQLYSRLASGDPAVSEAFEAWQLVGEVNASDLYRELLIDLRRTRRGDRELRKLVLVLRVRYARSAK